MVIGGTPSSRASARMERFSSPTSRVRWRAPATTWGVLSEGGRTFGRRSPLVGEAVCVVGGRFPVIACSAGRLFLVCRTTIPAAVDFGGESEVPAAGTGGREDQVDYEIPRKAPLAP